MKCKLMCCSFLSLAVVLIFSASAWATNRYVKSDGRCEGLSPCYSTISAAVTAVGSGDEIQIMAGTYSEGADLDGLTNVTLTNYQNDSVTLRGVVRESSSGWDATIVITGDASGVTVSNLTLAPTSGAGAEMVILIRSATDTTIDSCTITPSSGSNDGWLTVYSSTAVDSLSITNNTFNGYAGNGIESAITWQSSGGSLSNQVMRYNEFDFSNASASVPLYTEWWNEEDGSNYCYIENNYFHGMGSNISDGLWMFREVDGTYIRNNVFVLDSSWGSGTKYLFWPRGMTDGGDGCDSWYFTNNTIDVASSNAAYIFWASDTNANVEITNNLIIGNFGTFIEENNPENGGSSNSVRYNKATDSSVTWNGGLSWTFSNNNTNQPTVWNASGNKPNPYFDLTQSLDGGTYAWNPLEDYNEERRGIPADVGAFEYLGNSGTIPPAPPTALRIVNEN